MLDDGVGAGQHHRRRRRGGHGLIGMRERVALFGGDLQTGRVNGGGYRVRAVLPMQ